MLRLRHLLIALALLLAAAVIMLIRWREPEPVPDRLAAGQHAEAPPPIPSPSPLREEVVVPPSNDEDEQASAAPRRVGRVVVIDPQGLEHTTESGTISWILVPGSFRLDEERKVEVEQGRFDIPAPAGSRLLVRSAFLGGQNAYPDHAGIVDLVVEESVPLEVRMRWLSGTVLRVVDAETGADLREVQVVKRSDWFPKSVSHPGPVAPDDVLIEHGISPFELPVVKNVFGVARATLFARAPGYAWTRFQLDFTAGGEYRVDLQRAAELEVTLINYQPPDLSEVDARLETTMAHFAAAAPAQFPGGKKPDAALWREHMREIIHQSVEEQRGADARIRVRDAVSQKLPREEIVAGIVKAEMRPRGDGPSLFTDLPPGKCFVSVEQGDSFAEGSAQLERQQAELPGDGSVPLGQSFAKLIVLARQEVELIPGERTHVTLTLVHAPAAAAPAPLAGSLYLPPTWSGVAPDLRFSILDRPDLGEASKSRVPFSRMQPVAGCPGLYRWDAGRVVPGRYEARLDAFAAQYFVDVPAEGCQDACIEIGEPAEVTLHVLDERGTRVALKSVRWHGVRTESRVSYGSNNARYDATTRTYQFRAPAGRVEVAIADRRFRHPHDEIPSLTLAPGPNELAIHVESACGVVFSLRDGTTTLRPQLFLPKVESLDDGQGWVASGGDSDGYFVTVRAPGRYRVQLQPIDGYEPVAPFEVDIPEGEYARVSVAFERRR